MARSNIEAEIAAALAAGDRSSAAAAVLRGYGAELFGFLVAVLERPAAIVAYRSMAEMIALDIENGAGAGSLSIWVYGLARRAALSNAEAPAVSRRPDPTRAQRRYSVRFRRAAARLRRELSVSERILLVLRIARGFSWREIAEVDLGTRAPIGARTARARSLAQEFEALRTALRRDAIDRGVLTKK